MNINKDLVTYIENNIFPEYALNDAAHQMPHIYEVIDRSMFFAKQAENVNFDMIYAIAAYHDVKCHVSRELHEKLSAEALKDDENLKQFFTKEQIRTMAEAVEDHRVSLGKEPRSIYGQIVSSADRNNDIDHVLQRTYRYRMETHTLEDNIHDSYEYVYDRYERRGYAKHAMYFYDPLYSSFLSKIDALIKDKDLFRREFVRANNLASV